VREGVVYSDAPTSKNWAANIFFKPLILPRSEKALEPEPDKCLKRADAGINKFTIISQPVVCEI